MIIFCSIVRSVVPIDINFFFFKIPATIHFFFLLFLKFKVNSLTDNANDC